VGILSVGQGTGEWRNILLLAVSQCLYLIAAITVMTLSGVVGQQLAASPALATLPAALMMVGTVVFTLPMSLLMRRIGRKRGFLLGILLGGMLGSLLAALGVLQASFFVFCAGNLLLGLYQASAMYYRFAAAEAASDHLRSRAISLVLAGGVFAAFLGPWNASHGQSLPGVAVPEAAPYVLLTILSLLAALLMALLRLPSAATGGMVQPQRDLLEIAAQPRFRLAVTLAAVAYAMMMLVMTATPIAMRNVGFAMPEAAMVMQWHVLGMFLPSFFTGFLIARFGLWHMLMAGVMLLFAAAAMALSGQQFLHFLVALVLLGVGWNFLFVGASNLLTLVHTDAERGKVQGVNDLVVFALVAFASVSAGALLYRFDWQGLNMAVLPFLVLALLMLLRLPRLR